jgi:dihydrolipoamide dehydrogenase
MTFDIGIIGGGPGGYVAAIKAAQLGRKVVLFEKHKVGGICLNYGCIPTKTLLKTAKLYKDMKQSERFGIDFPSGTEMSVNWERMMQRKTKVVQQLVSGVEGLLVNNGVVVVREEVKALSPHLLKAGGVDYEVKDLIIATGSSSRYPELPGLDEALKSGFAVDSTGAIALTHKPKRLIILGGGVIAIEFATLFSSLGTEVVLIQRGDAILKALDQDIRNAMQKHLINEGIDIISKAQVKKIHDKTVFYEREGLAASVSGDYVLVSLGRDPNLKGLEALGLKINAEGIVTDEHLKTNIPHVYAIGDVNGRYMLAHVASQEGIVAVENICGQDTKVNYLRMASCIYSFPEVGVVGYTEAEAQKAGFDVLVSQYPLSANGKALAEGESMGFVKIVADKVYGEVLGVHIIASHATDMISEAVVTLELEGTVHDIARAVHPHPTLSEIVMEAAHGAVDKPIHYFSKT